MVDYIDESAADESAKGLSRRSVTRAAVWAVPAVSVAVAAPAMAASVAPSANVTFTGQVELNLGKAIVGDVAKKRAVALSGTPSNLEVSNDSGVAISGQTVVMTWDETDYDVRFSTPAGATVSRASGKATIVVPALAANQVINVGLTVKPVNTLNISVLGSPSTITATALPGGNSTSVSPGIVVLG